MPTLWRDPDSGIYYANFRIPTDLVSHYNKTHILKSLRTKQKREAEDKNEELRRHYKKEWASLRQRRSLNAPLSEDFIPHLIEEWLHDSLRADENGRIAGAIPRTKDGMSEVYYGLVDELAEGSLTGKYPDFLIRAAASFLHEKGITYDSRSLAFAKFVEELSPRYARYLNTLASRDEGQTVSTPAPPKQQLIPLSQLVREFVESRPKGKTTALTKDATCMSKFLEIVGDKPMSALRQQDIREFFQIAQRLPSQRGGPKKPEGITWREWAGDTVTMSPDTFKNNYVAPVRHFLKWAKSTYHDQGFPVGLAVCLRS